MHLTLRPPKCVTALSDLEESYMKNSLLIDLNIGLRPSIDDLCAMLMSSWNCLDMKLFTIMLAVCWVGATQRMWALKKLRMLMKGNTDASCSLVAALATAEVCLSHIWEEINTRICLFMHLHSSLSVSVYACMHCLYITTVGDFEAISWVCFRRLWDPHFLDYVFCNFFSALILHACPSSTCWSRSI